MAVTGGGQEVTIDIHGPDSATHVMEKKEKKKRESLKVRLHGW